MGLETPVPLATKVHGPLACFHNLWHAIVAACLQGEKMAVLFDAKPDWRNRWKLDDQGVIRVRKSVTRAASSLPALIMFALAPREGQELLAAAAFAFAPFNGSWMQVFVAGSLYGEKQPP